MTVLTGATPYFEVFDMTASVAFYRDLLGFALIFASPQVETAEGRFSHFVRLGRGKVDLMLNTGYDSNQRPPDRSEARWAGCRHVHLYVDCDDVRALHAELAERGLEADPPARTGYGYLGFSARDPDGYRIMFHEPLPGTSEAIAAAGSGSWTGPPVQPEGKKGAPMSTNDTYLAIFLGSKTSPRWQAWTAMSDDERKAKEQEGIAGWKAWAEKHKEAIVELGGPLGKTKRVSREGVVDVANELGAFTVVRAPSPDEAAAMFDGHPHFTIFPGEAVEVMPVLPIPGG